MTTQNKSESQIKELDEDKLSRAKDLIERGLHDVTLLAQLLVNMKDSRMLLERYMSDGTIRTACDDSMYYIDKLRLLSVGLETSKNIQDISKDDKN